MTPQPKPRAGVKRKPPKELWVHEPYLALPGWWVLCAVSSDNKTSLRGRSYRYVLAPVNPKPPARKRGGRR